jgi:phosphoglucosamine mutase
VANLEPVTVETALKLGRAAAHIFSEMAVHRKSANQRATIVIGKDTRLSGYMLENALAAGVMSLGANVLFIGPLPTPGVAYITRSLRADAGIVLSASHNPYEDNGIKFFRHDGYKLDDAIERRIEHLVFSGEIESIRPTAGKIGQAKRIDDALGRYVEFAKASFPKGMTLEGLHVAVDCANGATSHIAPLVFQELGAEVSLIGGQPNGLNINDCCGSTSPAALCEAVKQHQADIGIAFDGDGDRVILVNSQGEVVDGDEILYILAIESQRNGLLKNSGVVGTQMSNLGLEQALSRRKIPFTRTQVGDRYVMEELHKKQWLIGGESSGHIIWLSSTTTGDGIVAALQVLSVMQSQQKSLQDLLEDYEKAPQVLINIPLKNAISDQVWQYLLAEAESWNQKLKNSGRVLLRKSGTEPLIRIMVEGEKSQIALVAENLKQVVLSVL